MVQAAKQRLEARDSTMQPSQSQARAPRPASTLQADLRLVPLACQVTASTSARLALIPFCATMALCPLYQGAVRGKVDHSIQPKGQDASLVERCLAVTEALTDALAYRWEAFRRLIGRRPGAWQPTFGLRLIGGNLHRRDYTLYGHDRHSYQAGFDPSVRVVFIFRRENLSTLVEELAHRHGSLIAQPWRLLRYLLIFFRALRWRTPSGVLSDPRPIIIGALALVAMLLWRFWPYREHDDEATS